MLATEPLQLDADRCWRLGLIVYELVIISARHAFPGDGGEIRVELLRAGAIAQCKVTDNGSAAATAASGRGLKIIDELSKSPRRTIRTEVWISWIAVDFVSALRQRTYSNLGEDATRSSNFGRRCASFGR